MIIKNRDWLVVVKSVSHQSSDMSERSGAVCELEGTRKQFRDDGFGFCELQRGMHIYAQAQDEHKTLTPRIKSLRKQEKWMPVVMCVSG
jgi:hypothetical protein